MSFTRRLLRSAAAVLLAIPVLSTGSSSSFASTAVADRVTKYAADLRLDAGGVLHVQETVVVAEAGDSLSRVLRTRARSDADRDRIWRLRDITATVGGNAVQVRTEDTDDGIRVEVPTEGGGTTVVYSYDVLGAVADSTEGRQVSWSPVQGFDGVVATASITASIPFASWVTCFAGRQGASMPCTSSQLGESAAVELTQLAVPAGGRLTFLIGLSDQATVRPNAEFADRWSLGRAFSTDRTPIGLAVLLLGLGILGAAALWLLRGRDAASASATAGAVVRPVVDGAESADGARFAAPDGIRPGQVGTVVDESADLADITATVLDLAVRNYLTITELPRAGEFSRLDWRLSRRHQGGSELLAYERTVLDAVFADGDKVSVSELGQVLRPRLGAVRDSLYADVVAQGWFSQRPDAARNRWTTAGVVLVMAGAVLTVVLAAVSTFGLVGLAVMLAGVALAVSGQEAPARTVRGARVLSQIAGLRAYLAGETAADLPAEHRLEFASRCLPYATVLGLTERWAAQIAATDQDDEPDEGIGWYAGPDNWHLSDIGESLINFVTAVNGTVSARSTAAAYEVPGIPGTSYR